VDIIEWHVCGCGAYSQFTFPGSTRLTAAIHYFPAVSLFHALLTMYFDNRLPPDSQGETH